MKSFVKLIRNVSKEQYTCVVENLMTKRIPVACRLYRLTMPFKKSAKFVHAGLT